LFGRPPLISPLLPSNQHSSPSIFLLFSVIFFPIGLDKNLLHARTVPANIHPQFTGLGPTAERKKMMKKKNFCNKLGMGYLIAKFQMGSGFLLER
jgi:hypothetical protein